VALAVRLCTIVQECADLGAAQRSRDVGDGLGDAVEVEVERDGLGNAVERLETVPLLPQQFPPPVCGR